MDKQVKFLLIEKDGHPAGTPVTECAPTGAHIFANALVKGAGSRYYRTPCGDIIVRSMGEWDLVGDFHPQHPKFTCDLHVNALRISYDTLGTYPVVLSLDDSTWPLNQVVLCADLARLKSMTSCAIAHEVNVGYHKLLNDNPRIIFDMNVEDVSEIVEAACCRFKGWGNHTDKALVIN